MDRFWSHLGFQVGRPSVPKSCKNQRFFKIFGFLAILPTRGHMIHFLANLALNMRLKTLQNSTQDASKIDQKSIPTSIKILIKILIGFWSNFGPTWGQHGPQDPPEGGEHRSPWEPKTLKNQCLFDVFWFFGLPYQSYGILLARWPKNQK